MLVDDGTRSLRWARVQDLLAFIVVKVHTAVNIFQLSVVEPRLLEPLMVDVIVEFAGVLLHYMKGLTLRFLLGHVCLGCKGVTASDSLTVWANEGGWLGVARLGDEPLLCLLFDILVRTTRHR